MDHFLNPIQKTQGIGRPARFAMFCRASSRPFLLLFELFERENDAVCKTIEKFYSDELDSEL